jgi:ubiquinone biosynthesis accessory factor UbiJ
MFKPLLTRILNHLITQNSWSRNELLPLSGKTVAIHLGPAIANLTILEDGGLAMAGESSTPDASISLPPSLALRILAKDTSAFSQVQISGEIKLAKTLAKVLQDIRWDYEEDLSKIVGDIPATQVNALAKKTFSAAKSQVINMTEMLTEYWQEESPLIAKKRHVDAFVKEVDQLRDDVERLEKRLEKLKHALI